MNKPISVNERLQQAPETVLAWLEDVLPHEAKRPKGFNWLGLAEGAAFKANQQCKAGNRQQSLQWGEIAIAIYQQLSKSALSSSTDTADPYEQSEMHLRVNLIQTWGAESEHGILNAQVVCDWFFERLPFSLAEAAKQAEPWQDRQVFRDPSYVAEHVDDLRRLRRLKNHLNIVERLSIDKDCQAPPELQQWCELKPKLP